MLLSVWQKLFGTKRESPEGAVEVLRDNFVRTKEDRKLMERVLRLRAELPGDTPRIMAKPIGLKERRSRVHSGQRSSNYQIIFGKLDLHEAILLAFLSWGTVCPREEFATPATTKQKQRPDTMQKRLDAWDRLFGQNAEKRDVILTLGDMCNTNRQAREHLLVSEALAICKAIEQSPCSDMLI